MQFFIRADRPEELDVDPEEEADGNRKVLTSCSEVIKAIKDMTDKKANV